MTSEQPSALSTDKGLPEQQSNTLFPIVGIAASAGGLEAFTELLTHLPIDTGMAFVLIQHLAPDHKSLLTELLTKITQMPVSEVIDGITVEPNHVYIIAPNTKMILAQGKLRLAPREKVKGKYMPGDAFLISLAAERGYKAIAVILSGGDGDGSLALTKIKAAGGVTFAQCEGTAKFDSMPNTAVATGNVDFVLPPQKIAEEIAKLSRHPFIARPSTEKQVKSLESKEVMQLIFAALKSSTGVDFSHYKLTTLTRRLQRRMLLYKYEKLEDYAQYLQNNPTEIKALYAEILIHVTSFFRDPEAFQRLKEVFTTITQNRPETSTFRIWIAGCSTGEEAYSIAMCLLESLEASKIYSQIKIFATDISQTAIEYARAGVYKEHQMIGVSPERQHRFFVRLESGSYQISKAVRELCIFAQHDLGSDPPFAKLDLISCRNVLIYLTEPLQKQVLSVFHYSLNATGLLLLGTSESTGYHSDLFTVVDKKYRIYAKKLTGTLPIFSFVTSKHLSAKVDDFKNLNDPPTDNFDLQEETDRLILNRYAPVGVTIDDKMIVMHLQGDTSFYLKLSPGMPSLNLLKMVRQDLLVVLRAAIYQAQRQDTLVRKEGLKVGEGDRSKIIDLEIIPFTDTTAQKRYFLVLFIQSTPTSNLRPKIREGLEQSNLEHEIVRLRQEIAAANQERAAASEYLQAVTQEQERTNQDLKVANEEILSSNEELQSINEELETAKEEIQSTNEELKTINEELRSRNLELQDVNNDLTNLLASIDIPILMLTNDLRVRRFTPTAQKLLNFIPTDIGRPFSDIKANFDLPNLEIMIKDAISTLSCQELEVQTNTGYWYNLSICPYRTIENQIDGAVLVLIDIDALKRSYAKLEVARNYAQVLVETVQVPLLVLDADLKVSQANRAFYATFELSSEETTHTSIFDLGDGEWNFPELQVLLTDAFENSTPIQDFEVERSFKLIGQKTMLLNGCKVPQEADNQRLLLSIQDITERKLFDARRNQLLTQEQSARIVAEVANQTKDEFLSIVSHELRNPLTAILGWIQLLRNHEFDKVKTERALELVERSARSQAQLIEDILDTSRISSGKLQLNAQVIALAPVIESAIELVRLSATSKNIQIETVFEPSILKVSGDRERLQQAFWNLLSNAIKFTPTGGQVTVKLKRIDSFAQIQISDTGQGISADFLPYVFERFRQANSSTRLQGGLGLGLSIVDHLIGLHGGTVSAESPGIKQGSTFNVQLPLLETKQKNQKNLTSLPPDPMSESLLDGLRVLVVDDETSILELLQTILEQYGAEVTAVTSGQEAISVLTTHPRKYHVLLSDLGMPEQDGYALIRQVRALSDELGGQIPSIALTAYVREEEQNNSLAAGFQKHLAKPVEPEQLVSIIAEIAQLS